MGYTYRDDAVLGVDEAIDLYRRSTLGERRPVNRPDVFTQMLRHADVTITAWNGDTLVGIARTLTDFGYVAYLADLAVDEAHQRRGIGRRLVEETRRRLGSNCTLVLLAAPKANEYYAKLGFQSHPRAWTLPNAGLPPAEPAVSKPKPTQRLAVPLLAGLLALPLGGRAEAQPDSVLWSDGRTWSGEVTLGGDARLPLHDGKTLRPVPLREIERIEWRVETQRMERAWSFVEAGRTEKRYSGDPYPVRHWATRVHLANGERLDGQLVSTVFFLEGEEGVTRLVVKSKQRGKEGETFDDLAGPVEVRFGADEVPTSAATSVRVRVAGAPVGLELGVASLDPTQAATARRQADGSFGVTLPGARPVPALRVGRSVRVGWPGAEDAGLRTQLVAALPHVRDFFDDRRVLGVARDPVDPERCHSLMLLLREGRTTLGGPKPNPWHVEVWTWRLGDDGRLLFEARAVLCRDRRAAADPEPDVTLDPNLLSSEAWTGDVGLAWQGEAEATAGGDDETRRR